MTTLRKQVEQMARNAKKAGFSRNKAFRHAPTKPSLRDMFMAEYDRYQPRDMGGNPAGFDPDEDYIEGRM